MGRTPPSPLCGGVCFLGYNEIMRDKLLEQRKAAEDKFEQIKTSVDAIKAEIAKYGVESVKELEDELVRLQGEFRAINQVIENLPADKAKKVSPKADVIDATAVAKE